MGFNPESCMKINENLLVNYLNRVYTTSCNYTFYPNGIWDDDLFYSLIFTQRASRRLSSAALLRARNSSL